MYEIVPAKRLRDFDDAGDELDFLFSSYFQRRPVMMPVRKGWKPPADVYETAKEIVIVMDIAGIDSRDIRVQLDGNVLVLRGIRRERGEKIKRHYHKMEILSGPFERRIELPSPVDPEKVGTNYSQGFLEIRLPKLEAAGPRSIVIEIL